jgi:hypothetical protein
MTLSTESFFLLPAFNFFEWREDFNHGDTEKNSIIEGFLFQRKEATVQRVAKN